MQQRSQFEGTAVFRGITRRCLATILMLAAKIRSSAPNATPDMRIDFAKGRYELRNAALPDLIRTAWGVNAEDAAGGPTWRAGGCDRDQWPKRYNAQLQSVNRLPETRRAESGSEPVAS